MINDSSTPTPLPLRVAGTMLAGFEKHYSFIHACAKKAKALFDDGDWKSVQEVVLERLPSYDMRANETARFIEENYEPQSFGDDIWQKVKLFYIGQLINHKQPELAETFFNSVFARLLHRSYFHNTYIFARPAVSTEYILSDPPVYSCYYPMHFGLRETPKQIVLDFGWNRPFNDLDRDIDHALRVIAKHLGGWPKVETKLQIQVLHSAFYRNKAAYLFGKAINGTTVMTFAIPVLYTRNKQLSLDTILLEDCRIVLLFSLLRAYFMVDMEVPSGYVQFLLSIFPNKPSSEIYTMLGLGKQGKTMFFSNLKDHLRHSEDPLVIAPVCAACSCWCSLCLRTPTYLRSQRSFCRDEGSRPRDGQGQIHASQAGGPRGGYG